MPLTRRTINSISRNSFVPYWKSANLIGSDYFPFAIRNYLARLALTHDIIGFSLQPFGFFTKTIRQLALVIYER